MQALRRGVEAALVDHGRERVELVRVERHGSFLTVAYGSVDSCVGLNLPQRPTVVDVPAAALSGFLTALTLIVAIGAQNAFVLRQGIRREHVLPVVAGLRRCRRAADRGRGRPASDCS